LAVASVVVEDPSERVRVPAQFRPRVDIVNVWAVAAEDVKAMLLNSLPARLVPAKIMVPPAALVKLTLPVPGLQDAEVVASVQVPDTVQADEFITR
jgi:hypothetical protein